MFQNLLSILAAFVSVFSAASSLGLPTKNLKQIVKTSDSNLYFILLLYIIGATKTFFPAFIAVGLYIYIELYPSKLHLEDLSSLKQQEYVMENILQ